MSSKGNVNIQLLHNLRIAQFVCARPSQVPGYSPLESQILQILGLAALADRAEELMPEGIVVTAGSDRQGHGGTPTEQEHFLPGWS